MKEKISVIIGVVLVSMTIAGTVFAWGGGCGRGEKGDWCHKGKMEAIAKELNLTPEQDAQLTSAKETNRAKMENLRLALKEKRRTLKGELSKPGVTRQAVEPLVAEIKGLESSMTEARIDGIFKIKEILTPEQFTKLQAAKEAKYKEGKMKHRRKGW